MPANPLHFLAVAPLHFIWPKKFDITALLISSTFVDLELIYYFLIENHTSHGLWHSYFFVLTIYPIVLSIIIFFGEKKFSAQISKIYNVVRFYPPKVSYSLKTIYICCLIGGLSHMFFDMWTHEYSPYVLFPADNGNAFWFGEFVNNVFLLLVAVLSLITLVLWIKGMKPHKNNQ